MKRFFSKKMILLFALTASVVSMPVYSAAKNKSNSKSKKSKNNEKQNVEVVPESVPETENLDVASEDLENSIRLPSQKRTYFYKIDSEIMSDIEKGTPDSIRSALVKLRKNTVDYEENEKVLINIASEIMRTVWPSEKITWDIPSVSEDNPYMGAISSVNQGIFDSSTGNVDFFATVLPALVLLKPIAEPSVYETCEQSLITALGMNENSVLANYLMGVLQEKKDDTVAAEAYIKKAYDADTEISEIALAYVRILRSNGKQNVAASILKNLKSDPNDITVLKQNAYVAFETGNLQSAELYVARVLQQNPNDLEFVLFRARVLIEKNDYIHAVSLLDMYSRQDNSSIDYLILRAKVQLDWSKNTTAATETVEKALQLYPDNIDALMIAARISSITDAPVAGKYADELAAKVLDTNPENEQAMLYALKGLIQRENWLEAYSIGKKLTAQGNNNSELVESYVLICISLGKTTEAYEYAKKQLEIKPDDEIVLQAYVLAYSRFGSRDAVLKYIESLMSASSAKMKSYLYYRRSFLQLTEENALADLRSSLISNPRNSDALFRLYEMYYAKSDYRKAQYYLRQVVAINPNDNSVKQLNEALTKLIK